jgi:hypothetical protein
MDGPSGSEVRVALALVSLAASMISFAEAEEDPTLILCSYIENRFLHLVDIGELTHARRLKLQLESCIQQRKNRSIRDAREIIERYDRAVAADRKNNISKGR